MWFYQWKTFERKPKVIKSSHGNVDVICNVSWTSGWELSSDFLGSLVQVNAEKLAPIDMEFCCRSSQPCLNWFQQTFGWCTNPGSVTT